MGSAFRVLGKAFKDIWGDMFQLVILNVLTILAIVGPFLVFALVAQLLGIELSMWNALILASITLLLPLWPGMWLALYVVCNRSANEFAFSYDHFWAAFRTYWRTAWMYSAIALVVSVLLGVNFWWYGAAFGDAGWVAWVRGAWMALLLFWLVIQFYVYAFFVEQEDKRWRVAVRNAALVSAANPVFTGIMLLVASIIVGLSLLLTPVFVLLGPAAWIMFGTGAVVNRVNLYRERLKAEADRKDKDDKQESLSQSTVGS